MGALRPGNQRRDQRLRPTWRALRAGAIAFVVGCTLWLAGLVWFATPPVAETRLTATDAIVVLTGGSLRLQSGIELLREGKGRKLFISGVGHEVELDELLRVSGNAPDWASCCVALGRTADNTLGNARETAQWVRQEGFRSLRLVTAWYHMRRSLLEFDRAMPDIDIVAYPVFPDQVKQEHWWASRGTAALLVGEYAKFQAALLRPLLERLHSHKEGAAEPARAELRQ